ncbi:MAG: glycoside hydrolase family 15 protein, partial [Burkholderiaceae bacterium]
FHGVHLFVWWTPSSLPNTDPSRRVCRTLTDRLIGLQDRDLMRTRHRALFERTRDEIYQQVHARGYNEKLNSYVSVLGGDQLDATALLLGWYGFDPPDSARMRGTFVRLMSDLSPAPGLLFRNKEAGDDGAFGICSFWLADHLARGGGTLAEARAAFEATAAYANDVGLLSEEIEPDTGHALGNVPQNFTHVGLINAALSIAERARKEGVSP